MGIKTHIGKVGPSSRDLPPFHLTLHQQFPKHPLPVLQFLPRLLAPLGEPGDGPFDGALGGPSGTDLDAVEEFRELREERGRGDEAAEAVAGDGVAPVDIVFDRQSRRQSSARNQSRTSQGV